MSTTVHGSYLGNKRVSIVHDDSGIELITDAPKDNGGQGQSFSPTDLVGVALGSCIITTMAIVAERGGQELPPCQFKATKEMSQSPRRIAKLTLEFQFPSTMPEEMRTKMERVATKCPVHHSLHPETEISLSFIYN